MTDFCLSGHPFTEDNIYRNPLRPNARKCRRCIRKRRSEWRTKNPLKAKAQWVKSQHGMTLEEYEAGIAGPCEVCGIKGRKMHGDHDHKTGRFRGFLCEHCNRAIGSFSDNPELLRKAAIYLERS